MNTDENEIVTKGRATSAIVMVTVALLLPLLALPFHRLTDDLIHVPSSVIAHLITLGLLACAVTHHRKYFKEYVIENRYLLVVIAAWSVYLLINSLTGYYPKHSVYWFFSRFLLGIVPGFFLGFFLLDEKIKKIFFLIVFFYFSAVCFLVILEGTVLTEAITNIRIEYLHITAVYRGFRALWFQINPNEAGFFIVILFLVVSLGILELRGKYYMGLLFTVPVVSLALHFVNSRNAYMAFLLVVVLVAVTITVRLLKKIYSIKIRYSVVAAFMLLAVLTMFFVIEFLMPDRLVVSILKIKGLFSVIFESGFDTSILYNQLLEIDYNRPRIWVAAIEVFNDNPFFGVGYGAFCIVNPLGNGGWNAHNYLLDLLVEQGIVGFVFYVSQIIVILKKVKEKFISITIVMFPLMLLFDDLSWSFSMAIILFLLYGLYFSKMYSKDQKVELDRESTDEAAISR